jgi:hypothetical protein
MERLFVDSECGSVRGASSEGFEVAGEQFTGKASEE